MILLIDWGNTFLKYFFIDSSLETESQLNFSKVKKTDSLTSLAFDLSNDRNKNTVSMTYISSVRKSSDNLQLSSTLDKLNINSIFINTEKQFDRISCAYDNFENLGVDRWLTIIASHHVKKTIGIIDIGSAITLDVISENGQHLGGHIVPGARLLLESLNTTERVKVSEKTEDKDSDRNRLLLGTSTNECVGFGVDQMIQAYLEKSISEVTRHHQVEQWIFTGGGGEYWSKNLSVSKSNHCKYDGLLVFKGLTRYINR